MVKQEREQEEKKEDNKLRELQRADAAVRRDAWIHLNRILALQIDAELRVYVYNTNVSREQEQPAI